MREKGFAPIFIIVFITFIAASAYFLEAKNIIKLPTISLFSTSSPIPTPNLEDAKNGDKITTLDGSTTFFFPVGSFAGPEKLEAWVSFPCSSPNETLKYFGAGGLIKIISNPDIQPLKEFDITMTYKEEYSPHVDLNTLVIYRCSDTNINPKYTEKLSSTIDRTNKTVSAKSKRFGDFALLGKLKCENDTREPDDTAVIRRAQDIVFGMETPDVFDVSNDVDWHFIELQKDKKYTVETVNISEGVIPIIELSTDGDKIVQSNKNNPNKPLVVDPKLYYGYVKIKISASTNSKVGCDAKYSLLVKESS